MRFFTFLEIPKELNLRPLLFMAGAAAATAGAYYLLSSKFGARQQRTTSVDIVTQTDPGGDDGSPVDLLDDLLIRRLDVEPPEETAEEIRLLTVNLPHLNQQTVHSVNETAEEMRLLTVNLPHLNQQTVHSVNSLASNFSILNPIGLCHESCSSMAVLQCTKKGPSRHCWFPGLFLELSVHGEMHSAFRTVLFSHRWWHNLGNRRICVLRHCALLMRGPVTFAWWILTNDFFVVSEKCPTLYATASRVTVTKRVDGHLTRVTSFMFTKEFSPNTCNGFQETAVSYTGQALVINHDEYAYCEFSETVPQPEANTSSQQDGPETAGDCGSAVTREVPCLHTYSEIQGIENFALKMKALRQAFDIILSEKECLDYVCETGRVIFSDLATLNNKDLTVFEYLFDALLSIAQSPSYRADVEAELAEIGIQNFNFMDVVYETIMLRIQAGTGPEICPRPGGFLHHLMALLTSVSAPISQSSPGGEKYLCLVQNAVMVLLGKIFTLEESVYEDPRTLVHVVWDIFEEDAEDLLDRLEDI